MGLGTGIAWCSAKWFVGMLGAAVLVIAIAVLNGPVTSAQNGTIYVDQSASGGDDGSSWDDAFLDLQDALSGAADGDEIWIAEGTYLPTDGTDRTASFVPPNGVTLYGGFPSGGVHLTIVIPKPTRRS